MTIDEAQPRSMSRAGIALCALATLATACGPDDVDHHRPPDHQISFTDPLDAAGTYVAADTVYFQAAFDYPAPGRTSRNICSDLDAGKVSHFPITADDYATIRAWFKPDLCAAYQADEMRYAATADGDPESPGYGERTMMVWHQDNREDPVFRCHILYLPRSGNGAVTTAMIEGLREFYWTRCTDRARPE